MYAMFGNFTALTGKINDLVSIMKDAAESVGHLDGNYVYQVSLDEDDDHKIWVYEVWKDTESHENSLTDPAIRAMITKAMPLLAGSPESIRIRPVAGFKER